MADTFERKLGKRIRKFRHAAGLSQMDMVARGFSLSHYQKIERGALDPRVSTVIRIAKCFGVSVGALTDRL